MVSASIAHWRVRTAVSPEPRTVKGKSVRGIDEGHAREGRKRHQNEVDKVEGLMEDMAALAPEDAPWLAKLKTVHASLAKHIREEEQDIFPRIRKVWDEIRLKQAGTGMKAMKAKKLKPTAARRVA